MQRYWMVGIVGAVAGGLLLAANLASAQSPGASGAGIFVPKPRGSGESLDPNAAVAVQTGATVLGRSGDRLTGSVNSIANGVARFSGPLLDGEVGILTSGIRDIQFPAHGGAEGGRDLIVLMNDDRLSGTIRGMTSTDVAFDSAAAGFLKINNRYIKQMGFQGGVGVLARTNFAAGQPAPLQIATTNWQIAGGVMRIGPSATAVIPLDQSSAITVVIQFARMGQTWSLGLFADQGAKDSDEVNQMRSELRGGVERTALTLALRPNGYAVTSSKGAGQRAPVIAGLPVKAGEGQEIRFAYDPATTEVKLWINGQILNESKAPDGPKQGRYVVFSVQDYCELKSFAVLEGVVAPAKVSEDTDPNYTTIVYQNGQRMHAEKVALADGVFTIKTTFSDQPLSVPAEKVASISMSDSGRESLPPPEQPVQICLPKSLITVDLAELNARTAVAKSPYLGDIKIARDAIQSLRFLAPAAK